jgi:ABC-type transporter Mla subunit MlaD
MKLRWDWLSDLLNAGMPMMLGMSGSLPGPPSGSKKLSGPAAQKQLIDASTVLDTAEQALAGKQWAQARRALKKANSLIEGVQPNTPRFIKLRDRTRRLWVQLEEKQDR